MEYLICILPIALILWMVIDNIVYDKKKARRYQEYIDSIRVGDIFEPNFIVIRVGDVFDSNFIKDLYDDPFEEKFDYSEYSKVIIDIKKNNKGETWVKYKYLNPKCEVEYEVEFTAEIHRFARDYKRVKQSEI